MKLGYARVSTRDQKFFLPLLIILIFVSSCSSEPIQFKDLIGEYAGNKELSSDRLIIKSDSTYELQFLSSKGKIYRNTGTWELRQDMPEVTFREFVFFNEEGPEKITIEKSGSEILLKGNWIARVKLKAGELRIMYDSEHDIYFGKLSD